MENPAVSANNPMNPDNQDTADKPSAVRAELPLASIASGAPHATALSERPKRKRYEPTKSEVVAENAALKIRVHELETRIKNFRELPTMRRIVFAVKCR